MENETKCGVQEGNSEIYETKAIRYESNSTEPQCESRQMSSVKEDTGEDWHDVKKENDLDWDCHATDLLNASSSADVCGTDVSAHVRPLSKEKKIPKALHSADVNVKKEHEKSSVEFPEQCSKCGGNYATRLLLQEHIYSEHLNELFTCEECGRKFVSVGGRNKHKRVKHRNIGIYRHKCPHEGCDHPGFRCEQALIMHIESVHANIRPHVCETCGKAFLRRYQLNKHSLTHSSERVPQFGTSLLNTPTSADVSETDVSAHERLLCDEKKVPIASHAADVNLKNEHEKSTAEEPEECVKCGKEFALKCDLQEHLDEQCLGKRIWTCEECGQKFSRLDVLYRHKRSVHENRLLKCPYEGCDHPGHKSNRSLNAHIYSVHAHVRPYVCKTCGKTYVTSNCLREHNLRHLSEKPFQCKCGAKFRYRSSLSKHRRLCLIN